MNEVNVATLRELSTPRRMYEYVLMRKEERERWLESFSGRHRDSIGALREQRVYYHREPERNDKPVTDIKFRTARFGMQRQYCSVEIECFGVTEEARAQIMALESKLVNRGMIGIGTDVTIAGPLSAEVRISYSIGEYRRVYDVCNILRAAGAGVNKSCGLHVHFDSQQLTEEKVLAGWIENQDWIFKLVSKSRRTNEYCAPNTYQNKGIRRLALNLTAKKKHNTFEVRLHHGTLNPDKIRAWTELCHYVLTQGRTWKNVQGFCADHSVPLPVRQFAWERFGDLNVMQDTVIEV